MPAIRLDHVKKSYGAIEAVTDLSLSVPEGGIYGLLGPNGAGKTTTMEILTGRLAPDAGTVRVLGIDPVADPIAVRERVGILPETESPPSFMTPREYFDFVGTVRGLDDATVERRVDEWADRLAFGEKLDTYNTDLSRGQQQKVMIAAAFLHDPDAVFIDEPLSNLDPIMQERVKAALTAFADDGGTILLSTHNVDVAADICTRVGIVYDGTLVTEVTPSELAPDESLLDVFMDRVDVDRVATRRMTSATEGTGSE